MKYSPGPVRPPLALKVRSNHPESATVTRTRLTVTPEMARKWFEETNQKNRPLAELKWMAYAIDMLEGRWKYNGDASDLVPTASCSTDSTG
jgi:hypothetical protein